MACQDVELCQLIIDNHNEFLIAQSEVVYHLSNIETSLSELNGYLFFIIVSLIVFYIIRWLFNLIKTTVLGW